MTYEERQSFKKAYEGTPPVPIAEPSEASAEPVPSHPAGDGTACRCGAKPHPERAGFCARSHPLPGHGALLSRTHGLSEWREAAVAERAAFLSASIADDGGEAETPTRRRSLHAYRARLHVHIEQLSDAIERMGMFDKRGRLRALWLQRLEGLIAKAQDIDKTLGLARRAKKVPTIHDYLDEHAKRTNEAGR